MRALRSESICAAQARLFTVRQVALLLTFADQAVIAIENAAVQGGGARNPLTRPEQTATSEICA
jgi:GAF domain-containing protein